MFKEFVAVLNYGLRCQRTLNVIRLFTRQYSRFDITSDGFVCDNYSIKKYTEISNNHLTPELKLHLITPNCDMWYRPAANFNFEKDPFWAIYWPGGQALSRYLLDNPNAVKGKNVIDIGSGCGASAIAAAKCGANIVLANDIDDLSLEAVELNAQLNDVEVLLENSNLIGKNVDCLNIKMKENVIQPIWDIILVGDMFYDIEFTNQLFLWLSYLNTLGKTVFIGDPGRYAFKTLEKSNKLVNVADYDICDCEHFGFSNYSVWKMPSCCETR